MWLIDVRAQLVSNIEKTQRQYEENVDEHWMSQPYFWKSGRMTLTFPKWGLGSPPGPPNLQSSIVGVKTPHIEAFFTSLERNQSVDVENGLA